MNATNPHTRRVPRRTPRWIAAAIVLLPASGVAQGDAPIATPTERVQSTRSVLSEWIEVRRLISKEKADWAIGKDIVTQRIDLVKDQIGSLETKTEETRQGVAKTNEKKERLEIELATLTATEGGLRSRIEPLERRTKQLVKRLPSPLLDVIAPLTQQLPDDPAASEKKVGDRLRVVLGILNEVNRFHSEISSTTEIRELGDGRTSEVDVIYLGISYAYYVNAKGDAAGIGTASADAWQWKPANQHAAAIRKAIAIFRDKEKADFVRLPIRIE